MKRTIGFDEFVEGFRASRLGNYFSHNGLLAMFEFLGGLEVKSGDEFKYSPVDICCNYTEYASIYDAAEDYGITHDELIERTSVIEFEVGVIVENF